MGSPISVSVSSGVPGWVGSGRISAPSRGFGSAPPSGFVFLRGALWTDQLEPPLSQTLHGPTGPSHFIRSMWALHDS